MHTLRSLLRLAPLSLFALSCRSAATNIVEAKVTDVSGSLESIVYARVSISFNNPTLGPCELTRYSVTWPGGRTEVELEAALPPGTSVRTMRVNPNDGHLEALTIKSASVAVSARCASPIASASASGR
ncbi:MAG TPA: hypothetical protein VGL19_08420 [Polyangiaceae bacterium]|jgi:hypothetical protein